MSAVHGARYNLFDIVDSEQVRLVDHKGRTLWVGVPESDGSLRGRGQRGGLAISVSHLDGEVLMPFAEPVRLRKWRRFDFTPHIRVALR